jgi:hypothetical protein
MVWLTFAFFGFDAKGGEMGRTIGFGLLALSPVPLCIYRRYNGSYTRLPSGRQPSCSSASRRAWAGLNVTGECRRGPGCDQGRRGPLRPLCPLACTRPSPPTGTLALMSPARGGEAGSIAAMCCQSPGLWGTRRLQHPVTNGSFLRVCARVGDVVGGGIASTGPLRGLDGSPLAARRLRSKLTGSLHAHKRVGPLRHPQFP